MYYTHILHTLYIICTHNCGRKARTGQPEQDRYNWTGRTQYADRTGKTGQAEQDWCNKIARKGLLG
jgi:hypothetical protein